MKKTVVILSMLVVALSSYIIYDKWPANEEVAASEFAIPREHETTPEEGYYFQDIESFEKAGSIEEAFYKVIGSDRLAADEVFVSDLTADIRFYHEPSNDSRKEMIDLLHYIQFSDLLKSRHDDYLGIAMRVYQETKPGMNSRDPIQKWSIDGEKLELMDFSDKETMLGEIHSYGAFEGVNPGVN